MLDGWSQSRSHILLDGGTGVGAGQFLVVRRIFAQIAPNLPEKFFVRLCLQLLSHKDRENLFFGVTSKKRLHVFFCKRWAPFFEAKQRWA